MAWTNLTFSFGSVLTSAKMTQMYDNFTAMATKLSGSPAVQASTVTEPTQAQMETATDTTLGVTPRAANWHPGMAKCWGCVTTSGGTPTLQTSWNITSITDSGLGLLTVTIATDFSSANYAICATVRYQTSPYDLVVNNTTISAGSFQLSAYSPFNVLQVDPLNYFFACFGDQ